MGNDADKSVDGFLPTLEEVFSVDLSEAAAGFCPNSAVDSQELKPASGAAGFVVVLRVLFKPHTSQANFSAGLRNVHMAQDHSLADGVEAEGVEERGAEACVLPFDGTFGGFDAGALNKSANGELGAMEG